MFSYHSSIRIFWSSSVINLTQGGGLGPKTVLAPISESAFKDSDIARAAAGASGGGGNSSTVFSSTISSFFPSSSSSSYYI